MTIINWRQAKDHWQDILYARPIREIRLALKLLRIIRDRQRGLPPGLGVLPKTVGAWLDDYRCEQTLRKDMAGMWRAGLLERIGGEGARRGYRVAA